MYRVDHIPLNTPKNRRPAHAMAPTTITIHNTGNPTSTARNERGWLTNPANNRTASYHIVIDEQEAIECIPLNENAWHAGDGFTGAGNRASIGIELCESGDYAKTVTNAVKLVADMLKARNWKVDRLRRHYDWSKKICPRLMYDNGKWTQWGEFIYRVDKEITPDLPNVSPWAQDAYRWAISEGITDGSRPKDYATREEVITFLYRARKL
jgi:N-acetylmuramoyl-L-alanine amidase